MRIGPQVAPGMSRAFSWLVKRMIEPSPKRGSHSGEPGLRSSVAARHSGVEKGGPLQSAPSNGSARTS